MIHADSSLEVDLVAIADNYRHLSKTFTGKLCGAVVKANAYGLGVGPVASTLADTGCQEFFVASLGEAIELRSILPDVAIYVFHGLQKGQEEDFISYRCVPVLNSVEQVRRWHSYAAEIERSLPSVVHIDTGMNRLGMHLSEWHGLLERKTLLEGLEVLFLMSHLACADEPEHSLNKGQLSQLQSIRKLSPDLPLSVVNSYGVFLEKSYHYDIARPGMALYGMNPTPYKKKNPMKSVVNWSSHILQIREIDTPQSVGYGATCELAAGSVIATVPVGYADGFFRHLGNQGSCYVGSQKVPVVGRVSMDLITVDITAVSKDKQRVGQSVEFLGSHQTVDMLADVAGTIGYEVLTRLGNRLNKQYGGL